MHTLEEEVIELQDDSVHHAQVQTHRPQTLATSLQARSDQATEDGRYVELPLHVKTGTHYGNT